jgi:MFS family permease
LLWGGLSLSALGDQLYAVALAWIAASVFGANAGYLSAAQACVALLAVLGIGGWADRWDQRASMVAADLARALVLVAVVAAWLGTGGPTAAQLVVAIIVLALGQAVFQPALQSVLAALVRDPALLPSANGLLDATGRSARLIGPGLVALLAGIVPMVHFLTLDALSFLLSALALVLIGRLRPDVPRSRRTGPETALAALIRGITASMRHPLLGYTLVVGGALNGTWYAVIFLCLPLSLAHGQDGAGLETYGLVLSAYGCTNLAATVFFGGRTLPSRPQIWIFSGQCVCGAGWGLLGLASLLPSPALSYGYAAAAAVGAIGGPMQDIPRAVLRQTRLSAADIASATRAYMAASSAGVLMAMLLAPGAIELAGNLSVTLACGAVYVATGLFGFVRYRDWTETTP